MGRKLTISDDDGGVTVSVRIESHEGEDRVTSLHFDAVDGYGIGAEDLRLAEVLGLTLPAPRAPQPAIAPPPLPGPRRKPGTQPAKAVTAKVKAAKAGKRQSRAAEPEPQRYHRGGPVADDVLQKLWAQHGGVKAYMARELGVSPQTVSVWVRRARERGVLGVGQ